MARPTKHKMRRRKKVVHRRQGRVRKPMAWFLNKTSQQGPDGSQAPRKAAKPRIPESEDPLEEIVTNWVLIPEGYSFVPKGDVYITRKCRLMTKESDQVVYKVYDKTGKSYLGIRVPSGIYKEALEMSKETEESRAAATKARNTKFLDKGRELLREQFPLMPEDALEETVQHAFLKGSGRVGRNGTLSDCKKAQLAVEAHLRHKYTHYDTLLVVGTNRFAARNRVWDTVQAIRKAWEGTASKKAECFTLRLG